ncbi:uncharacterized protein [Macrobrachium rosenbergii]|uniref:uncharacterized protein n=1 Tax=Macrobrachium rosenbergii TaxID=79674 RepID=UPI0034D5BC62
MSEVEPQCEPAIIVCMPLSPTKPDTVKLPLFSRQNTASWFQRAKAHFHMAHISDDATKSDIVMTVLPKEVFNRISFWLDAQLDKVTYTGLENKLLNSYSMPMSKRAQRAFDLLSQTLGDASPREAWYQLRVLITLPGRNKNGRKRMIDLTKAIFLGCLPREVQRQIRDAENLDMDALVDDAQKLYEATKASTHATALTATTLGACNLSEEDGDDGGDISTIYKKRTPLREHRTWSNPAWCFYHRKFGTNARACRPPCSFTKIRQRRPQHDDRAISILGRRYHWPFVIADAKFPPLGTDFLGHHGLLVDVARQRLLDTGTCHSRQLSTRPGMPTICSTAPNSYMFLLQDFPDVFKPELHQSPGASAKHGIFHHITTMGPPTHAKFRRLSPRSYETPNGLLQRCTPVKRHEARGRLPSTWSPEEHCCLQDSRVVVRFDKCIFGKEKVDFLGHEISPAGVRPTASKVKSIENFPERQTIKTLLEFLGMINYYRCLIPDIAHTMLTTDASNIACGAVLEQLVNGTLQPLAVFSRKFSPAETRHSAFDRELLAIYHALQHQLRSWQENPVADALSRVEINSLHLDIDYEDLAREQAADPETADYRTAMTALKWKDVPLANSDTTLLCDTSTGRPRPLVPAWKRKHMFDIVHGLSHPSGRATACLMTDKFVWHGIS